MWFRNPRMRQEPKARGGVAPSTRRPPKFGPRVVEALEDRALMSMGIHGSHAMGLHSHHKPSPPQTSFTQTNLVSDIPGMAPTTDSQLVNPWGITHTATSPWWVSDNNAGVSTLYNGTGAKQGLVVTIPSPSSPKGGTPTGVVANTTTGFLVNGPGTAARFIFATEDGTIVAWNPTTSAVIKADNSASPTAAKGAVYKGLAMASAGGANYLYATNFRSGKVDVFDSSFNQVPLGSGAITGKFADKHIPHSFAPFGIATINGNLFVTYAKQDSAKHDDAAGPRRGFVDEFDPSGDLIQRVATKGTLDSPWGLAVAPSSFGQFSGDLLVGDFGDGRINAFQIPSGMSHKFQSAGQLSDSQGRPISIDGLWGLDVGNGSAAGSSSTLFFSAGIDDEQHGLFGTLTATT
jgi:uncharacterized protein (TIGR03118 family)